MSDDSEVGLDFLDTEDPKPKLLVVEPLCGDVGDDVPEEEFKQEGSDNDLSKPWMKFHEFRLVKTVAEVRKLIDACLDHGDCALDLETQGFDNRIEYNSDGSPYTRHKIVGYCIGLKGNGYYIPVRHKKSGISFESSNVDDVVGTEQEIKRLCLASQPVIDPESAQYDPLGAKDLVEPPKVVIKFWHAKFDQEFLYPITGIDWWHPDSFEDGMLAGYTIYTDGLHGLKDNALGGSNKVVGGLSVTDPKTGEKHPYEMIKFKDLFPKGMKSQDMRFADLKPALEGEGWNTVLYGCSDAICTDLLCDQLVPQAKQKTYGGWYRMEKQVVQCVRILERTRVKIDKDEIIKILHEAEDELAQLEKRIKSIAQNAGFPTFNPASASQLAEFLFTPKGLDLNPKPDKTDQGQFKTDSKTLEALIESFTEEPPEVLALVVKHRQILKIKGTYLENLANNTDEHDQIRINFKQTGAATGRFTAPKGEANHGFAGVPIQGIPARDDPKKPKVAHSLRRMFVAREGYVMAKVDYASQELRIAASVSGEKKWINEYIKELETGIPADLHFLTAQAFFPGLTKDAPDFKLKRGAGKCVHPDTVVLVGPNRVPTPIKDIGEFGAEDTFVDAPEGLLVGGKPVIALYNGGTKPLVRVVTNRGWVVCSENHRFVTKRGYLERAVDLWPGCPLAPIHDEDGSQRHQVIEVTPMGEGPCLDITMGTEEHLYRANGLLTHNTANFALVYGGGVGAVQRATGCDKVEGGRLLEAFHESVPGFSKWVKKQHESVKQHLGVRSAFHRFMQIPDAAISAKDVQANEAKKGKEVDHKTASREAKRIQAACERRSSNWPIQGSGADILKISLIFLTKELYLRGWLRNGGDDSVRIVMTVHDEVVFEIREDRVAEAVPVVKKIMEHPSNIVRWQVPLIAEPELGDSWAAKLDWLAMLRGDDKHPVPPYLVGKVIDPDPEILVFRKSGKKAPLTEAKPQPRVLTGTETKGTQDGPIEEVEEENDDGALDDPVTQVAQGELPPPAKEPKTKHKRYAVFQLGTTFLTRHTVAGVHRAITAARATAFEMGLEEEELPIEILDGYGQEVLGWKEGVVVHPQELARNLREYQLSNGDYEEFDA